MDYCNGGELFFHLKEAGRFDEPRGERRAPVARPGCAPPLRRGERRAPVARLLRACCAAVARNTL
eukprot:3237185-Prymnesium_polylepis.1